MAYNSKYTGAELEKKLDAVNDIPNLIDAILLNKNYITEEALKCFMKDYAPSDYSNIPIDNNTIYWENGLLKSKGGTGGGSDNCGCLWELRESKTGGYYLYSKYHVASKYGMSMYIEEATSEDGSGFIPDYVADLPIDNDTIYWSVNSLGNPILKAKVGTGGSEENNSEFSKLFKGHYDEAGDLIYIEALSDIIVNGGITIYAGNNVDVDSIYDGLPIDNNTIKWIETTNSDGSIIKLLGINPDIDLGGVSTWDELEGKPSWITTSKPKWDYEVDIYNKPNLSIYATLEYVNNEFKKYVTLDTDQTIKGFKDFEKGLSIGGLPITKSQDDVIYLDANLVVRGGITMFGNNSVDVPTIMDAIATDNVNLKVVDGVLTFVGSSGGLTEVHWDDVKGRPTLLSSFIDDVVSGHYLPLSGGKVTGQIEYNFGWGGNIPAAGAISFGSLDEIPLLKSFIGNGVNTTYNKWVDIISVRADNGSSQHGMYLVTSMTDPMDSLSWNRQAYGTWQGERVILDSVNWSQYVTAGDGGNYLPLSGGTMTSGVSLDAAVNIYLQSTSGNNWNIFDVNGKRAFCVEAGGYVGVGRVYDSGKTYRLAVEGNSYIGGYEVLQVAANGAGAYNRICLSTYYTPTDENWQSEIISDYYGNNVCTTGGFTHGVYFKGGRNGFDSFIFLDSNKNPIARISASNTGMNHHFFGDMLVTGGITMYSDQRKKTILNHVELSLKQIADAPLIEHYYNSDAMRTTHVGSIAQYWAGLNDWFCKLDNEGFYTMEVQNAALASAISIARELVKYESKTDRKIRLLKQRVKELEDKIKKLENN